MRLKILFGLVCVCTACSGSGSDAPATVPTNTVSANIAPTAQATAPAVSVEGETAFLSGSSSNDPDGSITSFSWRQVSGPPVRLMDANTETTSFQAPLVSSRSVLSFELTVTDDDGAVGMTTLDTEIDLAARSSIVEIETVFEGEDRAYSVYTPANYETGNPAVVLLHGGSGSMREVLRPQATTSGWIDHAETDGFLLIVPNGYNEMLGDGLGDEQSWNDIRTDFSGRTSLQDDQGFILTLMNEIEAARGYDASRAFVTGSSNGGIMTFGLLIEEPERFFGGASFIAALPEETIQDPLSTTPIMILNGTDDQLVLFGGGPVSSNGAPTRSVPDTIDYWLDNNDADIAAAVTLDLPDTVPSDGCQILETTYPSLFDDQTVLLVYEVQGGGHNVPDPEAPNFSVANEPILGPRCRDTDGIDLAFEFFRNLQ